MNRLFAPPFWPLRLEDYPSDLHYHDIEGSFRIGDVDIQIMSAAHPGGSTVFKLNYKGKILVFATDFEHLDNKSGELAEFAANADLLLYDAQYTEEDYEPHKGFGHSTAEEGIRIAEKACVKQVYFIHHNPDYTDEKLLAMDEKLRVLHPNMAIIKQGTRIIL